MSWKSISLIYKKEIQGAIRDRRTLISMIVIPLIFYPLLFLGIGYFSVIGQKNLETLPSAINIIGIENSPELGDIFRKEKNITIMQSGSNLDDNLIEDDIHLTIDIPESIEMDYMGNNNVLPSSIIIHFDSTSQSSLIAKKRVTELIDTYRKNIIESRLNKIGFNKNFLEPFQEK